MDVSIYNYYQLNPSVPHATLWLRHAEKDTVYRNVAPFYGDCPLSYAGKLDVMSMNLPDPLRWVGVVCSPYLRCYSTAMLLSQRLAIPCVVDLKLCNLKQGKVRRMLSLVDSCQPSSVEWVQCLNGFCSRYKNFIVVTHNSVLVDILRCIDPELGATSFQVCGHRCIDGCYSAIVVSCMPDIGSDDSGACGACNIHKRLHTNRWLPNEDFGTSKKRG